MSTLEKLLSVVTVSSAADVHVEPVSYFYTDDKGAKKEFKTEVGVTDHNLLYSRFSVHPIARR